MHARNPDFQRRPLRVRHQPVTDMDSSMKRLPLPVHLQGLFFDWLWDTTMVWSLPTPVSQLPFENLAWHLGLTVWSTVRGEPRFDLAPATVLAAPSAHARHWAKIQNADLSYPLELFDHGGRWVILDGYHRLCRHYLSQTQQVPVRFHPAGCRTAVEVLRRGCSDRL